MLFSVAGVTCLFIAVYDFASLNKRQWELVGVLQKRFSDQVNTRSMLMKNQFLIFIPIETMCSINDG